MASINKAIIVGNLGNDPEIRYSSGGDAIANMNIATTDSWKDKEGKQRMFGFSIERHGLKGAIELAFARRKVAKLHTIDIDEAVAIIKPQLS